MGGFDILRKIGVNLRGGRVSSLRCESEVGSVMNF